MTLDEAIEHAKQVANTCDNSECAANHMQLAEWLRRARGADKAARWYTNRIQKLEDENAKLRELAHLVAEYTSAGQCEGCVAKRACSAGELDMCWIRKAILEKLRELGVEEE